MDFKKIMRLFLILFVCIFSNLSVYAIKTSRIKQLEKIINDNNIKKIDKVIKKNLDEEKGYLLFLSVSSENIAMTEYLIEKGIDVNSLDEIQNTPLMIACSSANYELVELLLLHGANPNMINVYMESPLILACENSKNSIIINILLENGVDINAYLKNCDMTPLIRLIRKESICGMQTLIENGADVNLCDKDGKSPLVHAVSQRNSEIAKLLIENGADLNLNKDLLVKTSFEQNNKDIISLLLMNGINPNMKIMGPDQEISLLTYAVWFLHNFDIVELLIKAGANVNLTFGYNSKEHSLLWYARDKNIKDIEELLLKYGAKLTFAEKTEEWQKEEEERKVRELAEQKRKKELSEKRVTFDNFYNQVLYEQGIPLEIGDVFTIKSSYIKVIDRVVEPNGYTYLVTFVSSATENSYDYARRFGVYGGGFRHCFYINTKSVLNLTERTEFTTYERYVTNFYELKLLCAGKSKYLRNYQDVECYIFVGTEDK